MSECSESSRQFHGGQVNLVLYHDPSRSMISLLALKLPPQYINGETLNRNDKFENLARFLSFMRIFSERIYNIQAKETEMKGIYMKGT